jgi:hypothetical protein
MCFFEGKKREETDKNISYPFEPMKYVRPQRPPELAPVLIILSSLQNC